jgi:hypothetical protein
MGNNKSLSVKFIDTALVLKRKSHNQAGCYDSYIQKIFAI